MSEMNEADLLNEAKKIYEQLYQFTLGWYGEPCEDFQLGCPICESWEIVEGFKGMNFE